MRGGVFVALLQRMSKYVCKKIWVMISLQLFAPKTVAETCSCTLKSRQWRDCKMVAVVI